MIGDSTIDVARKYQAELIPPIKPDAVVHDNGCGVGAVTRAVLERYPDAFSEPAAPLATIYATDINPAFVDDFEASVRCHGWGEVVRTATMPAEGLSLSSSILSHSFTNFLIFGARDPHKVAAEVHRTLAIGGVAVITT